MRLLLNKTASFRIFIFSVIQPFLNWFFRSKSIKLLINRSGFSFTEIEELASNIPPVYYFASTSEREKFNDCYGIATILKQYAKIPNEYIIKSHIEHAIGFVDHLFPAETKCKYNSIILCGDYREKVLKKAGLKKKIHKIGPYINYATSFLTLDDSNKEKKRLGRNILVFPAHSVHLLRMKYDISSFCDQIKKIKDEKKFDTVRVCLSWKDANLSKVYHDHGFGVVTAGHVYDPLFLSRLRTLIELSSITITNIVGTHLGYSISLGRPVFLIKQSISRDDPKHQFNEDFYKNYYKSVGPLINVFERYSEEITEDQFKETDIFCGFSHFKTSEELRKILISKE